MRAWQAHQLGQRQNQGPELPEGGADALPGCGVQLLLLQENSQNALLVLADLSSNDNNLREN